jgi:hypothetical protein
MNTLNSQRPSSLGKVSRLPSTLSHLISNSSKIPKSKKVEDVFEEPIIEKYDETHQKHLPNRGTLNNDELA